MAEWRAGRSTGRTLWRDEQLVGMVDSPEIALEIVGAMRAVARLLGDEPESGRERSPGGPWTLHGHVVDGLTVAGPGRPAVYRCGGPGMCKACTRDAERLRREAGQSP